MKVLRLLAAFSAIAWTTPAWAQKGPPAWRQADSAIRADYAKREAGTKILEIT